ncbi:nucleotidyl transferase AbiEii/AbiGii toxin family protein [Phenylobacterium sp.]|uniref:nucleotidyl transferase AbiEii/AbiGii toxin family protein n=1 Tax=Phenylobacterium sp. TaxID=1871053 RepID=UPI00356954CD
MSLLHDRDNFPDLIAATARAERIDPGLVEKDYWVMHALWGLQQQGFGFQLKGGTSLSKGWKLIDRFSEDIDILIEPKGPVPVGRNQDSKAHVAARKAYFDGLSEQIAVPGFVAVERDTAFDDERFRSAGIRLVYPAVNVLPEGVKTGVLLEAGFDQVQPNQPRDITSWAYDRALASGLEDLTDNRALGVACYEPGYTLVEKLQTISTKYRRQQAEGSMPQNFLRHYYDVYCLLGDEGVQAFVGTEAYHAHKAARFRSEEPDLTKNPAFQLSDPETRALYAEAYRRTAGLYYREQPALEDVLTRIQAQAASL